MVLLIANKLRGRAKTWYESKPEYVTYGFAKLKEELSKMFKSREDKISNMRRFEAKQWNKNEKFSSYFQEKVALGNRLDLAEEDLIRYIIDGFNNYGLQIQARMKEFKTLAHMQEVMGDMTQQGRQQPQRTTLPVASGSSLVTNPQKLTRCYNCNEDGHISTRCPKPKREKGACYEYGFTNHQKRICPKKKKSARCGRKSDQRSTTRFDKKKTQK